MRNVLFALLVSFVATSVLTEAYAVAKPPGMRDTLVAMHVEALEKRVKQLEARVAELEAALEPVLAKAKVEEIVALQRKKARERMRKDAAVYTRDQLREIESLYQVANRKWGSQEGKDSLEQLVEKFDKANRTGCALLYLGQMSKGKEKEQYLQQAIIGFSDCYYGDGVQVGAYARYQLANYYKQTGQDKAAADMLKDLSRKFPDAIDHKGRLLSGQIKK